MEKLSADEKLLKRERWILLVRLDKFLEVPMNVLAFIWLVLTVLDLTRGLNAVLESIFITIWITFGVHFLLQLILAPDRKIYLKHNWLTALSLLLPALRIFRVIRLLRYVSFVRGTSFLKVISSVNRGMNVLSLRLGRKGLLYVISLTALIVFAGAAGIMSFEKDHSTYFGNYWVAVWWTTMMITTMGTDFYPVTLEGRVLSVLLAVYGFAIFGYVTASVATFFIDTEKLASKEDAKFARLEKELAEIKKLLSRRDN